MFQSFSFFPSHMFIVDDDHVLRDDDWDGEQDDADSGYDLPQE